MGIKKSGGKKKVGVNINEIPLFSFVMTDFIFDFICDVSNLKEIPLFSFVMNFICDEFHL